MSDIHSPLSYDIRVRIQHFLDQGWSFPLSVRKAKIGLKQYQELVKNPEFIAFRKQHRTQHKRGF